MNIFTENENVFKRKDITWIKITKTKVNDKSQNNNSISDNTHDNYIINNNNNNNY